MRQRVGIDIGGTYTDFVTIDLEDGSLRTEKTPSTPEHLWIGIEEGLGRAQVEIQEIEIAHGTTVALNTFLERQGAATGLLTTNGFRDAYEIGRGARPDMYNLFYRKPVPLVPRRHRREVRERLDAAGNVLVPLEEADVTDAVEHFKFHGIRDIAVCFLHSYQDPRHELRAAEIIEQLYPEAAISLSHELVREPREYERTSTTVLNAYIRPRTGEYIEQALSSLNAEGYRRPFFINQSSGGVISAATAKSKPVLTIFSGPAGGVAASVAVGAVAGFENVIAFDMGGTSTDVAVIWEGSPRLTADSSIERHPILAPTIEIHSVGAGGGSLAWIDEVGALNVGPQSAGASPGPVCYGRGGSTPTVTDANAVLGRVAPSRFIPGGLELDAEAAAEAIEREVGAPLGLDVTAAAAGIVEIANLTMAMAVRALTVQRGLDPTDFALFAFGGAGASHACWIARELGIPKVVVPIAPGQFSALGIALTNVRNDTVLPYPARPEELVAAKLREAFVTAEHEARRRLRADGVDDSNMVLRRSVDARYSGQEYTISVPVLVDKIDDLAIDEIRARFHELHERIYSHSSTTEPFEVTAIRIAAIGKLPHIEIPLLEPGGPNPQAEANVGSAQTCFDKEAGYVDCDVWDRTKLLAGNTILGPAIVADFGATTVIPPDYVCTVEAHGMLVVDIPAR